MPDQKPTLEYGRPRNPRKGLPLEITIIVVVAAAALASLGLAVAAGDAILETYETSSIYGYTRPVTYAVVFTVCGSLLLWVACRNIRRLVRELKCD